MSDEKTLFNRDIDSENKEKQIHSIAEEKDSDFVDFSSAFDGDDESDADSEEFEEEYEDYRRALSLFRGFSFLKRRKEKHESQSSDENEEKETEDDEPEKENIDDTESHIDKSREDSVADEEIDEKVADDKPEKRKKFKGFSLFVKKEKETEIFDDENSETEELTQEPSYKKEISAETIEKAKAFDDSADEVIVLDMSHNDKTENSDDEFVLIEEDTAEETVEETSEEPAGEPEVELIPEFEETAQETEEITEAIPEEVEEEPEEIEEQEVDKKRFAGFGFLKRKIKEPSVQKEETVEEAAEKITKPVEEPEIEMLPSFEESAEIVEEKAEEKDAEKQIQETTEEPADEAESENEPIPAVESVVEADAVETQEELVEDENGFIPPFESVVEEKNEEKTDEQIEKSPAVVMTVKDHVTFILIILALLLTIVFIVVKFIPLGNNGAQDSVADTQANENVSEIQLQRKSAEGHYVQSDLDNVFYVYSSDYKPSFYQFNGNKMKSVEITGTVNPVVEMGNEKISVKLDYVDVDGELFGTGVFLKNDNQGNSLNNMVVFKLVNLPEGYEQDGKALLLATNNSEALSKRCSMWNDSYVVELSTGKTTRFLTSDNSVYSAGYSLLTDEGYASTNGKIPFFSTRDYDATTNKRDIYLKIKGEETRFATDVAGSFVYTDAGAVSYLKVTDNGFNVVRKENGKENVIFSLDNDTSYLYHNEYLLDKYNGNLYNVKTGEKIVVTGYGMSNPEMMTVSPDGKYLVVVGAVNSAIDYQVHIFDLKTGNCAKYVDDNFSQHKNLSFVNDTTIIYSVVEPKQGYEYVILDTSKAF